MKKRVYYLATILCITALFVACSNVDAPQQTPVQTPTQTPLQSPIQSQSPETIAPEAIKNRAIASLNLNIEEDNTLAVILNFPDEETLKKVPDLKTYENDDQNETLLLIPVENGTRVEVKNLEWDNQNLKETGTAYVTEKTEDGYGLFLRAMRPEGAPYLKIVVESPSGAKGEYLLTYNGKDGNPEIEYIKPE